MKTLLFDSSSSANASFKASRTATSLAPLGVAYFLLPNIVDVVIRGVKAGLEQAMEVRGTADGSVEERTEAAGRRIRTPTMSIDGRESLTENPI